MPEGAAEAWLEVRDVRVRYGESLAVEDASFRVGRGTLAVLVGPSGCGKTSLLRAIAGFETPVDGEIRIGGEPVAGTVWVPPERRRVGMVFQQGALFPHLTALDNVLYGLRGRGDRQQRARRVLSLVGMESHGRRFPDELSGGEQQRVALARALAPQPRLMLLDEPFASLDAALRRRLREDMRQVLKTAGMTAVLVTHDQEEALSIADYLLVMEGGRVLQTGPPHEIYQRPNCPEVARMIGDGRLLACEALAGEAHCLLGKVRCRGSEGPGWLLVRSEDLTIRSRAQPGGAACHLGAKSFYGHDLLQEVVLTEPTTPPQELRLQVRLMSSDELSGSTGNGEARVCLRDKVFQVFPRHPSAGIEGLDGGPQIRDL